MAVKIDLVGQTVTLGVGDLVSEPLAQVGRVGGLSVWARLAIGRETHTRHQSARARDHAGYAREIPIKFTTAVDGFQVSIQGRIDGVYPAVDGGPVVVEEVKSVVLPPPLLEGLGAASHPQYTEQLRLYCYFVEQAVGRSGNGAEGTTSAATPAVLGTRARSKKSRAGARPSLIIPPATAVVGRLVFVNVADGQRREIELPGPFDDCAVLIADRVRILLHQATATDRRRAARRAAAPALRFPHLGPRRHQDEMIAAVGRALTAGRHLLVSAPSGIGKTAGALYPVLQYALAQDKRVFFITAKNTQHAQALETLRAMGPAPRPRRGEPQRDDSAAAAADPARHQAPGAPPTAVSLRAREKMCINQIYACREEFCPHLQHFAIKLERTGVVPRLLERRIADADAWIEGGRGAGLCPFELALLGAETADVVVGDYNYVFDPQVYLRRFFEDDDQRDAVLVIDEAHNLLPRALDYYSPRLRRRQLAEVRDGLSAAGISAALARDFRRALATVDDLFDAVARQEPDEYSQVAPETWPAREGDAGPAKEVAEPFRTRPGAPLPSVSTGKLIIDPPRAVVAELRPDLNRLAIRYFLEKSTRGLVLPDDPVEQFFADFNQFATVLALEGEEFTCVLDRTAGDAPGAGNREHHRRGRGQRPAAESPEALQIVCADASRQLADRLAGFHSVIAMSATLTPLEYYRQMLGFDPEHTDTLNLPSPFPPERRRVVIVPSVLTTYRRRHDSYGRIASVIAATAAAQPGHYLALFPSYEYLRRVAAELGAAPAAPAPDCSESSPHRRGRNAQSALDLPGLTGSAQPVVYELRTDYPAAVSATVPIPPGFELTIQSPRMTEPEQQHLLASLRNREPPQVVLAVQGGLFAEGVDYPGNLLAGVIVVSPALPQVSFERELRRQYCQHKYGKGFEYAYLYPGMNRVIQAVGRLIRSETDRGVAVLVCQRFTHRPYRELFPADWGQGLTEMGSPTELAAELSRFWLQMTGNATGE